MQKTAARIASKADRPYVLDEQIGFILRQVMQRHALIFVSGISEDITSTQWAALAKLAEAGSVSQNLLGRLTVMDAATIKGVIDRLTRKGLTATEPDPADGRRRLVTLTQAGLDMVKHLSAHAARITEDTLAPLHAGEREALKALLLKLR